MNLTEIGVIVVARNVRRGDRPATELEAAEARVAFFERAVLRQASLLSTIAESGDAAGEALATWQLATAMELYQLTVAGLLRRLAKAALALQKEPGPAESTDSGRPVAAAAPR